MDAGDWILGCAYWGSFEKVCVADRPPESYKLSARGEVQMLEQI